MNKITALLETFPTKGVTPIIRSWETVEGLEFAISQPEWWHSSNQPILACCYVPSSFNMRMTVATKNNMVIEIDPQGNRYCVFDCYTVPNNRDLDRTDIEALSAECEQVMSKLITPMTEAN